MIDFSELNCAGIESMSSLCLKLHLCWLLKLEICVVRKIVITINCYTGAFSILDTCFQYETDCFLVFISCLVDGASCLNCWFSFQQRFAIKAGVLLYVDFKDYSFIYLMYCPKLLMQSNAI